MPQFHIQDGPSFFQYEPVLPVEAGVPIWRDDDTITLAPSADPGLWKSTAVQLVQFDLQSRITTAWLADGTTQRLAMPTRVHRRLCMDTCERGRQQVILDVWGTHVLKDLVLPPSPALWVMQMDLRDAQAKLPSTTAALQTATDNVQRLVDMTREMRDAVLCSAEPGESLALQSVPQDALVALLHGIESDIEQARTRVGDMQARVEYNKDRHQEDTRRSIEMREKAAAIVAEASPPSPGCTGEGYLSSPTCSEAFDTADSSEESDENTAQRREARLVRARELRDKWHVKLESLLNAREAVHNRMSELTGSMRSRMRQRWAAMTTPAPSQLDRLCLSHQALSAALVEAKEARSTACEAHARVLEAVAESECRLNSATTLFNSEAHKMQQCDGELTDMGARVRRNSFSDEEVMTFMVEETGERRSTGNIGC
eukprot:TRINITY_DN7945_c0_g1_i3.p1 TRINITY_DN7945_c0_g1~~TRINITY_DN7945_c0_g1_i3.p1  ORF type:complete len:429 (-),score=78.40 TRINITY_DN7945_c0_g1_i3:211-1497(-)